MRDKAEVEFEKVRKKHSEHISIVQINLDKNKKLESVDIRLRPGRVVYVMDLVEGGKGRGFNVDIVNKFDVSRADILNGSFAKSFDGFYKYDANEKLGLIMGLGYVFGQDVEIITPKFVGNIHTEEMNLSTILNAYKEDMPEIYKKKETASRAASDYYAKQKGAGIGAAKRKKQEVVTYVFSVYEITGISERSGSPIFAKGIQVKVRRANYDSAQNFVKSKYSYQKTKKHYFVELKQIDK
jgi:hypothetical protein